MLTDLVLSPLGADPTRLVSAAIAADAGFDGVYTYDHFSGTVAGRPWSRDPFVLLGAIAASTRRVRLGVLVANMVNRHPAQLASAVNTLQAIAGPTRVICGIGSGAAPGSPFAAEHELIGRRLADAAARRQQLAATIATLRSMWSGAAAAVAGVVDDAPPPPIIIGASSRATVELAAEHADGVNVRRGEVTALGRLVELARSIAGPEFEFSVFDSLDPGHPLGGDPAPLADAGIDRRTLVIAPPYPHAAIVRIAANLAGGE